MKLLQYLILTILIANGSLPLVQDVALASGNEVIISFFEKVTDLENCSEQETEGEDASDDDVVHQDNHSNIEPKPHDSSTKSSSKGSSSYFSSSNPTKNYTLSSWEISSENATISIDEELLRHTYYSKRNTDTSHA